MGRGPSTPHTAHLGPLPTAWGDDLPTGCGFRAADHQTLLCVNFGALWSAHLHQLNVRSVLGRPQGSPASPWALGTVRVSSRPASRHHASAAL